MSLKMFHISVSALLFTDIYSEICKDYFCICGDIRSYLKQCNNKIRSAISSVLEVITKHAISMPILMTINITYKPGDSETIDKFIASVSSVLGAPFLTEESANQFIRLKRHIPYSLSDWDLSSSQNMWGYTVAEQISESWAALRETAQYYMDLDPFAFSPSRAMYDGVSQESIS